MEFVKHGPKGRHVKIPDGWVVVEDGVCLPKDRFYDLGRRVFRTVESDDIGFDVVDFDILIREKDDLFER